MSGVRFTSTRDPNVDVDFTTALVQGQPKDGGLFIPRDIPRVELTDGDNTEPVSATARRLLPAWIGPELIAGLDLESIWPIPIPKKTLHGSPRFEGMTIVELFHGPTGSFKDFGARFLAACYARIARDRERPSVVVVATSGDTGSAVADAFAGRAGMGVVILYPHNKVSAVQQAQLTLHRPGVWAFAVEGSFDDCQQSAKAVIAHGVDRGDVVSANSINVGRLLPQMLFYTHGFSTSSAPGFVVPCGNLGNLTAGLLSRSSAIPGATFVAATNANDYFARVLHDPGAQQRPMRETLSNAMDVANPSNLERIEALYPGDRRSAYLSAFAFSDDETVEAVETLHRETGYLADPHTAVGICAALRHRSLEPGSFREGCYIMSTADPAKYRSLVESVTGAEVESAKFAGTAAPPRAVIRPEDVRDAVEEVVRSTT